MPRSITYRPQLIDELITNERLNSYKPIFSAKDDVELVGAYLWNMQVCSALYPIISAAEVTLRNSINNALTHDLGNFWWKKTKLHYKSFSPGVHNLPFAVSVIRTNFSGAAKKVKQDKKNRYGIRNVTPSHHELVAKADFSTWEFIFDKEFMGSNLIWPKNLGVVLRGAWPSTKASATLQRAQDLTKTVREFRNRAFHHEPAWKKYGVANETDAIACIHEKIARIEELMELVSPEKNVF